MNLMMKLRLLGLVALGLATTGCMPKMTIEEMKAMRPERPAALDRLNAFAGRWEFEGTARFEGLDRPLRTWGTSEGQWEGDNWYLVSNGTFNMEEFGEMKGHETWTYDTKAGVYRYLWVDSMGMSGMGTARYDAESDTWSMEAKSQGPHGSSTMKGTCQMVDDNTMQWKMAEHAGLMKVMEMNGTSKRVR